MNHVLKQLREERMLTQQDLASKAGLTVATLSRLENRKARPRPRTIRTLAEALGIDPGHLRRMLEAGRA